MVPLLPNVFQCFSGCGNSDWNLLISNVNLNCVLFKKKKKASLFPSECRVAESWQNHSSSGINLSPAEWELERGSRAVVRALRCQESWFPCLTLPLSHQQTSDKGHGFSEYYCLSAKGEQHGLQRWCWEHWAQRERPLAWPRLTKSWLTAISFWASLSLSLKWGQRIHDL